MTSRAHDCLSVNLSDFRALCRQQVSRGLGLDARELAGVAELLARMEMEAIRLETLEIEVRAFHVAEQATRFLSEHPIVDLAALEAAAASDKVVIFPGRGAAERRPS